MISTSPKSISPIKTVDSSSRLQCSVCNRAGSVCICSLLPKEKFNIALDILVLQHPNEKKKGLTSSIPLVNLCLNNVHVIRGISFNSNGEVSRSIGEIDENNSGWWVVPYNDPVLSRAFTDPAHPPLLLYPGENSVDMEKVAAEFRIQEEAGVGTRRTLIIIDGTWTEAKKIIRRSPSIISHSRQVKFSASVESLINPIRRGNTVSYMSSLEAVAAAIRLLDCTDSASAASENMLAVLNEVVNKQLNSWGKAI